MLLKILKNNFIREKVLLLILFVFILTAAVLVSTGTGMFMQLRHSISHLMTSAAAADWIMLHKGDLKPDPILEWAFSQPVVKDVQIEKMLNLDSSVLFLGNAERSEEGSIISVDFVQQNETFDFLLDLGGNPIHVAKGEIAVPVYFMQQSHLKIGDKVRIVHGNFNMELTIAFFVRDALMNPALVHSKRFVVNGDDFALLENKSKLFAEIQHIIAFRLTDTEKIDEFTNRYQLSNLPQNGPIIDYRLIRMLHAMTDGVVIGILILVSLLLLLVALLCLRFTILASIEEDYQQVGVMKALGIPPSFIRRIYLLKYAILTAVACVAGYLCSLGLRPIFSANMRDYLGLASGQESLFPLLGTGIIFTVVVGFCAFVLRRLQKISAMEVLREASREYCGPPLLSLKTFQFLNLNVALAWRDLLQRSRLFLFLGFVFFICVFIVILPLNFWNTMRSPTFLNYMGIAPSEMRIDVQGNDLAKQLPGILKQLESDNNVKEYAVFSTYRLKAVDGQGVSKNINTETGVFSHFPIQLLEGKIPENEDQIALSYLQSKQLQKMVGDLLELRVGDKSKTVHISGIYQDITNGGLSAKALFQPNDTTALWHIIQVNFLSDTAKILEYRKLFPSVRIASTEDFLAQTLGHLLVQIKWAVIVSMAVGLGVLALIASLFFRMLITKDSGQIAILRALGFSIDEIRLQYLLRAVGLLSLSIALATATAGRFGTKIMGLVWSFLGAPAITPVIDPIQVYLLLPLVLISFVLIAIGLFALNVRQFNTDRFSCSIC